MLSFILINPFELVYRSYLLLFKFFRRRETLPDTNENRQENAHLQAKIQHPIASALPQEILVIILRHLPRNPLPPMDVFTAVTQASSPLLVCILDIAHTSAPLVCKSWHGPATQTLYEFVTIYSISKCELFCRTLRSKPSLAPIVQSLQLPRSRSKFPTASYTALDMAATPVRLLELSTEIITWCRNLKEVDLIGQIDHLVGSQHPSLESIRVTDEGSVQPSRSLRIEGLTALRELTLCAFSFDGTVAWPEFPQLVKLRLEHCEFSRVGDDLSQILPRTCPALACLELLKTYRAFRSEMGRSELPAFLSKSLQELWIEHCRSFSFESHLQSYNSLRIFHADRDSFVKAMPFLPQSIRTISIAVPIWVADSAPDYKGLEECIRVASRNLPLLESVEVVGDSEYPLLHDVRGLEDSLEQQGVRLVVKRIKRGRPLLKIDLPSASDQLFSSTTLNELQKWDSYIVY